MSNKNKKSGKHSTEKIALATVIINLLISIINLISKIFD